MTEEVTFASLSEFYDTVDTTNLYGNFNASGDSQSEGRLTEIKAEETYNTHMNRMVDLCARNPPSDLMLMWLLIKRIQKKP